MTAVKFESVDGFFVRSRCCGARIAQRKSALLDADSSMRPHQTPSNKNRRLAQRRTYIKPTEMPLVRLRGDKTSARLFVRICGGALSLSRHHCQALNASDTDTPLPSSFEKQWNVQSLDCQGAFRRKFVEAIECRTKNMIRVRGSPRTTREPGEQNDKVEEFHRNAFQLSFILRPPSSWQSR